MFILFIKYMELEKQDDDILILLKELDKIIEKNNYKLTADKIITILNNIKNNPNISSKRWIWELMQNATDVRCDNEKISIQIIREEDKLIFMHNGKYFTINNVLGLLQQVSSKNSLNLEGQTGKFGTGFIGTHLLSDIIDIKGILKVSDDDFREFQTTLDRSEKISEKLSEHIEKSIEKFKDIEKSEYFKKRLNYLQNRKETDYDTSFTYYLQNEENKKTATEGLNDLINTMPTTLITQHNKIKQVTIIDKINNINITYISNFEKEVENDITESSVKIIKKNKENEESISELHFLSYLYTENNKEILRLIIEIEKKDGIIYILKRDINKPVLYRNFPLIGSNEFHMPFIVDGFNFNPLETREGIFLNGGQSKNNLDTKKNIDILNKAYKSSLEFIKCLIKKYKNVENRFFLASSRIPKPIVNFDLFASKLISKKQIDLRENLKELELLKHEGYYHKMENLLLPIFNEKCNDYLYDIVNKLNIRKKILPEKEDYKKWYDIIIEENNENKCLKIKDNKYIQSWGKREDNKIKYIYDENDLLIDIQKCKNIDNLSKILNINKSDTIKYLNEFIEFLKNNCKYETILNNYSIIPNRNGEFKKINELYTDNENNIPKIIMDIYDSISEKKLNDELIDKEININNLNDIINKKNFDDISSYLNKYILENKNINNIKNLVVYPLLSIKTDNNKIQQIYEYLSLFYSLEQKEKIEISDKIKIPIDLWTHALNFWFNEHPKEIESYHNINGFKEKILKKEYEDSNILKWMNNYLKFLKLNSSNRNFEKLKIFPNQNKNFCELEKLHYDSGFQEEYKDILKKYFNIDKREILLSKEIETYKTYQLMSEYDITNEIDIEFNKLKNKNKNDTKLKDIAFDILCLYPTNEEQEIIRKYLAQIICPINRTKENLLKSPIDYSGLSEIIFNKSEKYIYKKISTKTLNYLLYINYIFEILCNEIDKCNNFENIKNKFYGIKTQNDLELLLIKIIKFQWDNEKNEKYAINDYIGYNSNKKIFLNMNNNLISIKDIRIKEEFNFDENNEKILLDICLNKHINKDFRNELINENIFKQLSLHKHKFKSYTLKDICNEIDQFIMKYDQTNSNNGITYDNDFFNITQNLKKIKYPKEQMKELFPYYWKNKSRISISCFNEDDADHLMTLIKKDNFANQIKFLESFSSTKNLDKLNELFEKSYGNINELLRGIARGLKLSLYITFKVNQKFKIKVKIIDENQKETYIYSKHIILPEENNYKDGWDISYTNNILFKLDKSNKQNELNINYEKNQDSFK